MQYEISDELKRQIVKEHVEPSYIKEVQSSIRDKTCWKKSSHILQTISKVLVAVGCILSFSSGYYGNQVLSFLAGSLSTVSLALLQFASYSYGEYKKQGQELNIILQKLKIDTVPIMEGEQIQSMAKMKTNITPVTILEKEEKDEINNSMKLEINELHNALKENYNIKEKMEKEIKYLRNFIEDNVKSTMREVAIESKNNVSLVV